MSIVHLSRVDGRLKAWGNWYVRQIEDECGGAPRQSAFCAAVYQHSSDKKYVSHDAIDLEIEETDRLVKELGKFDKTLEQIIRAKYTESRSDAQIYRALGIFKGRYYEKLSIARTWLAASLFQLEKR